MVVSRSHDYLWENKLTRTWILSILIVLWTLLIELYFLFWPIEEVENHFLLSFLYIDFGLGSTFLADIFHGTIWSLCIFFTWILYTLIKQSTGSNPAGIIEYFVFIFLFAFFILFINNLFVTILFVIISLAEFGYMYLSLADVS